MSAIYLDRHELAALEALDDGRWRTPTEIASIAQVHVQNVRSALHRLASRRLIERGGWGDSLRWGEWRITGAGRNELDRRAQLELEVGA